jgi:uncharacterized membrane protein (Fun14 family)
MSQNLNSPIVCLSVAAALLLEDYSHTSFYSPLKLLWLNHGVVDLSAIDQVFHFITSGSIAGLPPIVLMIIIFVIGLIVGYLIHLFLEIAIIAAIVLFIVAYFGFWGLSLSALKNYATQYGSIVYQYGALIIGILPVSIGFIVGLIIGFVFS